MQPKSRRALFATVGIVGALVLAGSAGFLIAPQLGPQHLFIWSILKLLTWLAVGTIACLVWGKDIRRKIGLFAISLVAVWAFFAAEIRCIAYAMENLFPRPVFMTDLSWPEDHLLPIWRGTYSVSDEFGQAYRADHLDNVLAVVLTGVRGEDPLISGEDNGFWLGLGPDRHVVLSNQSVYNITNVFVPRTSNALVLVRPDGQYKAFALGKGLARQFDGPQDDVQRKHKNVLREARELLDTAQQNELDAFISDYREPQPSKPTSSGPSADR